MNIYFSKRSGKVIRRLRSEANLSLRELARDLGWNPGTLSKYETGRTGLSTKVIEKIAPCLNTKPEVICLLCLKLRYPEFKDEDTLVGQLFKELLSALEKEPTINAHPR